MQAVKGLEPTNASLIREADRCVKCGMCLPDCPTYRLAADESESPRGRIALIEGLLNGRLDPDAKTLGHLDSCLGCRRCERLCPSQVRFGHLMDAARVLFPGHAASKRWQRWLQAPELLRLGAVAAHRVPAALSRPFGRLHHLHELARALPAPGRGPRAGDYPTDGPTRGRIGLFPGCTGAAQQPAALHAAIRLLNRCGFDVSIPADSGCCGALAAHSGDVSTARRLADTNRAAFPGGLDAVVSIASGCGVHLDTYEPPLAAEQLDICRFLLEHGSLAQTDLSPLKKCVALHTPCSVENVYRGADWAPRLLQLIPDIRVIPIGETGQCCGAAGDHMLRRPERAARLRQALLERLADLEPDLIATSNVGCAMHLAEGLRGQGASVEIVHPIEIVARQLVPEPSSTG